MADLVEIFSFLEDVGAYEIALPFLLIFTLSFAILEKSGLLSDKNRGINVVVSIILGLLFVRNQFLVALIGRFLPNVSLFMVIILMFLLLIGLFGAKSDWAGNSLGFAAIVSVLFVIWALAEDFLGENVISIPSFLRNITPQTKATVVFVGVFILIIWLVTKQPKKEGQKNFLEKIGEELKKSS